MNIAQITIKTLRAFRDADAARNFSTSTVRRPSEKPQDQPVSDIGKWLDPASVRVKGGRK